MDDYENVDYCDLSSTARESQQLTDGTGAGAPIDRSLKSFVLIFGAGEMVYFICNDCT